MAQKSFLRRNMNLFIGIVAVYFGLMAFLYVFQRNFQYFPGGERETPAALGVDQPNIVSIAPEEGLDITGWYWPPSDDEGYTVVYFHGNAQAYGYWMDKVSLLRQAGHGVLFAEYRGYGGNNGFPTERGLYQDARTYLKWLINDHNIDPQDIVFYGESLGTGVAIQMATEFSVRGLILESAYSSTADIAKQQYWMFPVDVLMKDQYRSIDKIAKITAPLLFIHAQHDGIIPIRLARSLHYAANEPKKFVTIERGGHNDLYANGALNYALQFIENLKTK